MKWRRSTHDGLHSLEIYDCRIDVLEAVARAAGVDVTVENVRPVREWNRWFESMQTIDPDRPAGRHRVRNETFDVALTNAEFLELMRFWDRHGVYAVFTERSPIAFQASELEPPARYKALANFGFVLELAIPGSSGDGWGGIVTPRAEIADLAERLSLGGSATE